MNDPALEQMVLSLLREGRKIEAVKLYRERTGVSLARAKEAVESVEAGRSAALDAPLPAAAQGVDARHDPEVRAFLAAGNKIEAIKRYREITGLGLAEAKRAVEALPVPTNASAPPQVAPTSGRPDASLDDELRALIAAERKIDAIKLYRERSGSSLLEAKVKVEALADEHRPTQRTSFTAVQRGSAAETPKEPSRFPTVIFVFALVCFVLLAAETIAFFRR